MLRLDQVFSRSRVSPQSQQVRAQTPQPLATIRPTAVSLSLVNSCDRLRADIGVSLAAVVKGHGEQTAARKAQAIVALLPPEMITEEGLENIKHAVESNPRGVRDLLHHSSSDCGGTSIGRTTSRAIMIARLAAGGSVEEIRKDKDQYRKADSAALQDILAALEAISPNPLHDDDFRNTLEGMLADEELLVYNTKLRSYGPSYDGRPFKESLKRFTVENHVAKMTGRYDKHFADKNDDATNAAMELSFKMRTLGHSISAGKLNNPRAQPVVTEQLFKAHARELGERHSVGVLALAKQLATRDPLMGLLHGKISLAEATWQIRVMAERAQTTPQRMLDLLRQQLDCELGSHRIDELHLVHLEKDETRGGQFLFDEIGLAGEMIPELFCRLVDVPPPPPRLIRTELPPPPLRLLNEGRLSTISEEDETNAASELTEPMLAEKPYTPQLLAASFYDQVLPLTKEAAALLGRLTVEVEAWGDETGVVEGERPARGEIDDAAQRPGLAAAQEQQPLSTEHLEAIRSAKLRHPPSHDQVALPGTDGLTERQYSLLRNVRMKEPAIVAAPDLSDPQNRSPKQQVLDLFKDRYGLGGKEAERLLEATERWFQTAPLTITFKANDVFGKAPQPAFGTRYKAAQELATKELDSDAVSELVRGDGVQSGLNVVSNTEPANRGVNYVRWRVEKDAIETQHRGLTRTEQAIFGAVNINFEKTGGFEGSSAAYGESFLVLKPEVRERAAFNFNKTRELRAGATMLIYDMIHNRNSEADPGHGLPFVDAMVHRALGLDGMRPTPLLQLEVEIFGDLDMVQDVQEVTMPPSNLADKNGPVVSSTSGNNLREFFKDKNISVREWDKEKSVTWDKKFAGRLDHAYKLSIQQAASLLVS